MMLTTPQLWRIEPDCDHAVDSVSLAEDLRRYLRDTPLTTILVVIGGDQRAYLKVSGCDGCSHGRCGTGCRTQLLRRLLRADHAATDLLPVPHGLAARPYTRLALAWPNRRARPLDGLSLACYREARLAVVWRVLAGRLVAGASLAVGVDGPDPALTLRSPGWQALSVPDRLVGRFLAMGDLGMAPLRWIRDGAPDVLLPAAIPVVLHPVAPIACDPVDEADGASELVDHALRTLQAAQKTLDAPGVVHAPMGETLQSKSPATDPREHLESELDSLIARILTTPVLTGDTGRDNGLSVSRLRALGLAQSDARRFLLWLAQAGLLEPAPQPTRPWRAPRLLITSDAARIVDALRRVPPPTTVAANAAFGPLPRT